MTTYTLKAEPMMAVLTPYALARSSHHLFCMARNYQAGGDADLMRHYALCASIELGLKAAILGEDCTSSKKAEMKAVGHDLIKLDEAFQSTFGKTLFDDADLEALNAISPHFKQKGLEYFTLPVLESTLKGRKDMPALETMGTVAGKVNEFLSSNQFFIEGKTTDEPSGGIITFI